MTLPTENRYLNKEKEKDMTVSYEWDCENCYVDRDGVEQDVIDHGHENRVKSRRL
jgi:hypothetical protein